MIASRHEVRETPERSKSEGTNRCKRIVASAAAHCLAAVLFSSSPSWSRPALRSKPRSRRRTRAGVGWFGRRRFQRIDERRVRWRRGIGRGRGDWDRRLPESSGFRWVCRRWRLWRLDRKRRDGRLVRWCGRRWWRRRRRQHGRRCRQSCRGRSDRSGRSNGKWRRGGRWVGNVRMRGEDLQALRGLRIRHAWRTSDGMDPLPRLWQRCGHRCRAGKRSVPLRKHVFEE